MRITSIIVGALLALVTQATHAQELRALAERTITTSDDLLSRISAITIARDGRVFVAQPVDGYLLVFKADGSPPSRLGRLGSGPGEFLDISAAGWIADTLWVVDPRQRRVAFFPHGEGPPIRTDRLPLSPVAQRSIIREFRLLADGALVAFVRSDQPADSGSGTLLRISQDGGRSVKAIRDLSLAHQSFTAPTLVLGQPGWLSGAQPLADNPLWSVSNDGTVIAVVDRPAARRLEARAEYIVTIYDAEGHERWRRAVGYRPLPTSAEWLRQKAREFLTPSATAPKRDLGVDQLLAALYRPSAMPPVSAVVVGLDGVTWVRREEGQAEVRYDRLAPDGRPLAGITLPAESAVLWASQYFAWIRLLDADGLPSIQRVRLELRARK